MSSQCINCQSKDIKKLFVAQKSVCNLYNVQYKPNRLVCGTCLQKSIIYFDKNNMGFKNEECILDVRHPRTRISTFELSDSDDDNAINNSSKPSAENPNPHIAEFTTSLNAVLNDTVAPLITKQNELCNNYLVSKKAEIVAENKNLNNLMNRVDQGLSQLYNNLYKFDSQKKFVFDEEISIDAECEPVDNDDLAMLKSYKLPEFPHDLPVNNNPERHLLKLGDKVYGMKYTLLKPWVEAAIKLVISDTEFNIMFDDGEEKVLYHTDLAYINTISDAQYPLGSRVIAKFQDMNIQLTDKFYVGIIAEPPKYLNNFRYLIFFDSGYTQYVYHKNIRLVYEKILCERNIHANIRKFMIEYFDKYPERRMVKFNEKQLIRTELNNVWYLAKVTKIDASLVQLKFLDVKNKRTEWIYRGSNRLGPVYNQLSGYNQVKRMRMNNVNKLLNRPYIELEDQTENEKSINIANSDNSDNSNNTQKIQKPQKNKGVVKLIELPANCQKALPYMPHKCSHFCMLWVNYDYNQTKYLNVLSIPMHYGFMRSIIYDKKLKLNQVIYTTPCGCKIDNESRMYNYLKVTNYGNSPMTIDLFNFDCEVNPLSMFSIPDVFISIHDLSHGTEFKAISVVNSFNDLLPQHINYIKKRKTAPSVYLNKDLKFLCGCDCTDDCEDKNKCACWQLTHEALNNYPTVFKDHEDIGYRFKRLHNQVLTGIFECNPNCLCGKTCLNRVVQEPLKTSLQLFLTEKKGWGVRTLADIPKGSFVCTFLGEVRTEKDAESDFSSNWGEFLADLDFLETAESLKVDYESYVDQSEDEDEVSTSSSDDEEFTPSKRTKSMFESRMSLRKNLQDSNTQIDGKHKLPTLNSVQGVESRPKSLRTYLDEDCGNYTLDSKVSGNIGRYFNHSCDPNLFVQNVFVDTHDLRFPWVAYFALSNISAGTELGWDYNYVVGSVENKRLQCNCGSKNCRGRLL